MNRLTTIIMFWIFLCASAHSASTPSLSFHSNYLEVTKGQIFYIELNLHNEDTFVQGSFEITYDKSNFKCYDLISSWPGDQVEIGSDISDGMVSQNTFSNTTGIIAVNLTHKGQSKDDIKILTAKFECLTENYGNYSFNLSSCSVNNTAVTSLPTQAISLTSKTISQTPLEGGVVDGPNGSQVIFPANALQSIVQIYIKKTAFNDADHSGNAILKDTSWATNDFLTETSVLYEIAPYHKFERAVEIVIPYSSSDVPTGFSEDQLALFKWIPNINGDSYRNAWVKVGGKVDKSGNKISLKTKELGVFLILGDKSGEASFNITRLSVSPNPFSPASTPNNKNDYATFSYFIPNSASRTLIEIYDVNGRLIQTIVDETSTSGDYSSAGEHRAEWDGRNLDGNLVNTGIYVVNVKIYDSYGNVAKKARTVTVSKNMNE